MVLNPALYAVLKHRFGNVKIVNQGVRRIENRRGKDVEVLQRGENYAVCCPLCSDTKFRLTFSYLWLTRAPMSTRRVTALAHCYNENCAVTEPEFYESFIEDIEAARLGLLVGGAAAEAPEPEQPKPMKCRLPEGMIPLSKLPAGHPALQFLAAKYHRTLDPVYMSDLYGAAYVQDIDMIYPKAQNRIIFPITVNRELVGWQGRTIDPEGSPRWYLPPGWIKTVYNVDNIMPSEVPVITEGITSAIAAGPNGVAIFGKMATESQIRLIAERWRTAIIATDPETFVPDPRNGKPIVYAHVLKAALDRRLSTPARFIRWPAEYLELAKRMVNGEDVDVPDPASVGMKFMAELLQ